MTRWYRRPRPRATTTVLLARVVGGLLIIGLYVALRLPELTSATEAAATWAGAVFCFALILPAVERLYTGHRDRIPVGEPSLLELTDQFEVPSGWPGSVENAIAEARHAAMTPLIDRGEIVEPKLFTHEFDALHHTPPRGIKLTYGTSMLSAEQAEGLRAAFLAKVGQPARFIEPDDEREPAADMIKRLRAERPSPTGRVVVSHAPVQITRDRFGQLFSDLS